MELPTQAGVQQYQQPSDNTSIPQAEKTTTNPEKQEKDQPPCYNDISGAVIIDWDGSPRFLSPQEEQERQSALENAVREKMLGLPRKTEFAWARPEVTLPAYLPETGGGDKGIV